MMSIKNSNPILKRIAVKAECFFSSPALIGSGLDDHTDSDILRCDNRAFLPGSTVAGVLRSISGIEDLFGKNGISPLWVYDTELTDSDGDTAKIIELDGVAIDPDNKVALDKKKYDYEAVDAETEFTLRFLLTIREKDSNKDYEEMLDKLNGSLKSGSIAFGAKTRRGFGAVQCTSIMKCEFLLTHGSTEALTKWLEFDWASDDDWIGADFPEYSGNLDEITANLKLDGSIMIRDTRNIYEDSPNSEEAPDYKHLSISGRPAILGTSWAGAFRSGLFRLLKNKYPEYIVNEYINDVFGHVTESDIDEIAKAEPSKVYFDASFLEPVDKSVDGYRMITRVKIDRFTGGAADGALFSEMPWYGGQTEIKIRYKKGRNDIRELVLLGLDAMDKGIIQIGGEASVGRGFFKVTEVSGGRNALSGEKQELKKELKKRKKAGKSCEN
jgi:CRISPR/Cas system CSM-associated protein Csm3 (group 7 of RAMP superfamily)